jgi:hypothetical protein
MLMKANDEIKTKDKEITFKNEENNIIKDTLKSLLDG